MGEEDKKNAPPQPEFVPPPFPTPPFDEEGRFNPGRPYDVLGWNNSKGLTDAYQIALYTQAIDQANRQSFQAWDAAKQQSYQQWQLQYRENERFDQRHAQKDELNSSLNEHRMSTNAHQNVMYKRIDQNRETFDYLGSQPTLYEQALQAGTTTGTNAMVLGEAISAVTAYARIVSGLDREAIVAFSAALATAMSQLQAAIDALDGDSDGDT